MFVTTVCGLCGGSTTPYFSSDGGSFNRCRECDVLSRVPMPSTKELDEIYRHAYSAEAIEAGRTNQETPLSALDSYVRYIGNFARKSEPILDFGSGTGQLALALQRAGYQTQGFESSPNARSFAEHTYGLRMAGNLSELCGRSFGLVVMIEVIEHLVDPLSVLVALRKLLGSEGRILVSTPNRAGLRARLSGAQWSEAHKPFHLYLFNPLSLARLLSAAGFSAPRQLKDYPLVDASRGARAAHRAMGYAGLAGRLFMIATAHP